MSAAEGLMFEFTKCCCIKSEAGNPVLVLQLEDQDAPKISNHLDVSRKTILNISLCTSGGWTINVRTNNEQLKNEMQAIKGVFTYFHEEKQEAGNVVFKTKSHINDFEEILQNLKSLNALDFTSMIVDYVSAAYELKEKPRSIFFDQFKWHFQDHSFDPEIGLAQQNSCTTYGTHDLQVASG